MKKYICNPLWLLLLFVAFISSCDKEEIVFDHELPQFELRSDAILLEVIMPMMLNGAYTSIRKILLMERHLPMAFISFLRHKV